MNGYPLTVTSLSDLQDRGDAYHFITSNVVSPGEYWGASFQVSNDGVENAGAFSVDFYASTDNNVTSADHFLGRVPISGVAVDDYMAATLVLPGIPGYPGFPGIPAGDYYVGIIIDSDDDVSEFDETNNVAVALNNYPLTVESRPDLYDRGDAYSWFDPDAILPGQPWTARFDVFNGGNAAAGGFWVDFYAQPGTTLDGAYYLDSRYIEGLAAGAGRPSC